MDQESLDKEKSPIDASWIALAIGNSRLHWAIFQGNELQRTWNTPHLALETVQQLRPGSFDLITLISANPFPPLPFPFSAEPELWIASVVPDQTAPWKNYSHAHFLTLEQVPLQRTYPTLGIDRALSLWGAISTIGSPVLVIDAGTALTFTGADENHQLIGGAILAGVQLQFQALNQGTAALPKLSTPHAPRSPSLPPRWAQDTNGAIASGIIHTLLAGIQSYVEDWWQEFPDSKVVLTGGDSDQLHHYLKQQMPEVAIKITVNPFVAFEGIRAVRQEYLRFGS